MAHFYHLEDVYFNSSRKIIWTTGVRHFPAPTTWLPPPISVKASPARAMVELPLPFGRGPGRGRRFCPPAWSRQRRGASRQCPRLAAMRATPSASTPGRCPFWQKEQTTFAPANQTYFSLHLPGVEHHPRRSNSPETRRSARPSCSRSPGQPAPRPDPAEALLGQPAFLALNADGSGIHAQVHACAQGDSGQRLTRYHLTLRPQLLRLRLVTASTKVDLPAPDGAADRCPGAERARHPRRLRPSASRSSARPYPARDYCVQYDESDPLHPAPVRGAEGIHYHFQHLKAEGHVLGIQALTRPAFPSSPPHRLPAGPGLRRDDPADR